ncbi:LacI family DNA-binding transcriptional regulator [Sediminivirga luteola]|uniref:substrate-binding domain-containing protein n=1 Tax=Sediminivirga luteola TaxID=1774748 RepID=UPI001669B364|nr:LacI family DNA-binding transcriptional regulator [Sediminivirga luteola]MCI2264573.1 LacI family transcriptional regulator [Sediminivirga luteola]
MRVSVEDVAREAGVSPATVSRVFARRGNVAGPTADRVREAADRLGYRRSTLLDPLSARLIGVCAPYDPEEWQRAVCQRVADWVEARGMLVTTPALFGDGTAVATAVRAGAAAMVAPIFTPLTVSEGLLTGIDRVPVLRLAKSADERIVEAPGGPGAMHDVVAAGIDIAAGLRAAFDHLTGLGHRRIGLICNDRGYLAESLEVEFAAHHPARAVRGDFGAWTARVPKTVSGGAAAARRLLDATCTAVIVQSARQLHGVYQALRENRMMVPRDLSVIALGDSATLPFLQPAVTALRFREQEIADALLLGLQSVLEEGEQARRLTVPPSFVPALVSRDSTARVR